jgi:thiamine-phosphate pyrophosphorylase
MIANPKLRVVTDAELSDDEIDRRTAAICEIGKDAVCIHLRDPKHRNGKQLMALAERLRTVTQAHGSRLVLGSHYEVALRVRFDGFHGWRSPGKMGDWLFSVPVHDASELGRAIDRKADAALVSPIFGSPGKGEPRGLDAIREARRSAPTLFLYALGGVDETNARSCIEAGANGIAVIRALYAHADPTAATVALLRSIG